MHILITTGEKRIPRILFLAVLVMLIPFIITFNFFNTTSLLKPLVAGTYLIEILLIVSTFINNKTRIQIIWIFIAIFLAVFQLITMVLDLVVGLSINVFDIINSYAEALNFILLFGVMTNVKVKREQLMLFMKYVVIFSVVACLYNLVINWNQIAHLGYMTSGYQVDLKSFFANRNQFGAFIFVSIVAHVYMLTGKRIKMTHILIFLLQLLSVMLTMSRGSILACVVFFVLFYIQNLKNIKSVFFIGGLWTVLLFVIVSNHKLMAFITKYIIREDAGLSGRSSIWSMGINVAIKHNIINGVGYYTGLDMAKSQGLQFDEFHSLYIDKLVEGGIIGLAFLILVLTFVFYRCLAKCGDKPVKRVYTASFIAILVLGAFESVSFFSIGYVDTIMTIFFVTIPLLLSNMENYEYGVCKSRLETNK